jgi:LAO/AO transport system kinase
MPKPHPPSLDKLANLDQLKDGSKSDLARALAALEAYAAEPETVALLSEAWTHPKGHIIGLTGPPGVGKSTLIHALVQHWRSQHKTVGVIAVDPSSLRSGGALLGDRVRIMGSADDDGLFIRSMAARDQIGGLAELTAASAILMRSLFDIVLVETVGIGQSQTDIANIADTLIVCIQPGSGDSLQFMKAGIMEIPDIAVVTKADLGAFAQKTLADLEGALGLAMPKLAGWTIPCLSVAAERGDGMVELKGAITAHQAFLNGENRMNKVRRGQGRALVVAAMRERYGREGVERILSKVDNIYNDSPFTIISQFSRAVHLS